MSQPAPDQEIELVCPAGTPAALKAAVDAGADTVYLGFRDETNARNFPGLNFTRQELHEGLAYAHARQAKIYLAVNTFPTAGNPVPWHRAVEDAAKAGVDAVILADMGLLDYAQQRFPQLRRHLSVQASAANTESIRFYTEQFDVKRVVLPRVLSVEQIAYINRSVDVETEVFAFGGLCVMAEGRCALSSYATGESPNLNGACSPAAHVRFERRGDSMVTRLGDFTVNVVGAGEDAGYPTLCKGRFAAAGHEGYLFEEPTSLNVMTMLPELAAAGVSALKIEGRQRGRAYVTNVVSAFRRALDAFHGGAPVPEIDLAGLTEGGRETSGAYRRDWR